MTWAGRGLVEDGGGGARAGEAMVGSSPKARGSDELPILREVPGTGHPQNCIATPRPRPTGGRLSMGRSGEGHRYQRCSTGPSTQDRPQSVGRCSAEDRWVPMDAGPYVDQSRDTQRSGGLGHSPGRSVADPGMAPICAPVCPTLVADRRGGVLTADRSGQQREGVEALTASFVPALLVVSVARGRVP